MRLSRWLVLGLAALLAACNASHTYGGAVTDPPAPIGDFTLTDQANAPFALSEFKGKWIMLYYGYTHCPDVCPMTLSILRDVKKTLGPDGDQIAVAFVTIDPDRDTVDLMGKYVAHFDASFKALTGTPDQIAAAAKPLNVKYDKRPSDQPALGYTMAHTAFVYLIDPQFRLRVTYPFSVKSEEITADLQYLMKQPTPQQ